VEFIAKQFNISKSRVKLVAGEKTRHKVFELEGIQSDEVATKLNVAETS